ncbi:Inosamine-phosphate amidinotransferase 1 [Symmachiella macrocystis]|uniref:Inosamine-phosphate amidinotransferase 1 n=1 Tax=Symmachiella macrocystis TaxID=2527985 RepID=A0A5C6AVI7_9PLAN|nr:Inosamine-phosphate amidinotransferase 1 [Symmachiella macrocystis]
MKNHPNSVDRREFLKYSAGAVAATTVSLSSGSQAADAKEKRAVSERNPIMVNHEWGTLKEVVCGIPNVRIPSKLPDAVYNYAPSEGIKFFEANLGKTLKEADPKTYGKVVKQMDATIAILEKRGVKVHRPEAATEDESAYLSEIFPPSVIQFYPRDPMVVIGNKFIETELFFPLRRRERFGQRRALAGRLANSNAQMVSMPPAVPTSEQKDGSWGPGPFLEGGDVFLLGKDIYVGVSGNASNAAGVQWLAQFLGSDYNVHEVKLAKKFLHLDCCLATPREGLAIICKEAFVGGLPDFLKDWELIELPYVEAKEMLGCNGLVLDSKTIIIHTDLPHLGKALRKAGQEVIETPFDAVYQYAGAFRCWHHPLVRESTL